MFPKSIYFLDSEMKLMQNNRAKIPWTWT